MPLALTCDCGARFDVDDLLAGQEVPCPECTEQVKVSGETTAPRTSLWALAALGVVLLGGFTPAGGLLAVGVGLVALLVISRRRKHLTGQGIAYLAIGLGVVSTAFTAALFFKPDLLPFGSWMRQQALRGRYDATGELLTANGLGDATLTRPSRDWGRLKRGHDPSISEVQRKADFILYNPRRNAYVDHVRDTNTLGVSLRNYRPVLEVELNPYQPRFFGNEDDEGGGFMQPNPKANAREQGDAAPIFDDHSRDLDALDGHAGKEWKATAKRGGQTWRIIVRAYRKIPKEGAAPGPTYVFRAYTPLSRIRANEAELVKVLDTARIQP